MTHLTLFTSSTSEPILRTSSVFLFILTLILQAQFEQRVLWRARLTLDYAHFLETLLRDSAAPFLLIVQDDAFAGVLQCAKAQTS